MTNPSNSEVEMNAPLSQSPIADETYYKSDGDCFLLVGGIMFRLHRFLLTRDSSIFETMFTLPAASDNPQQGTSLSDPIILHEDAEDFRALCWVLYALPNEVTSQSECRKVKCSRLISLTRMSKKYQFTTIEKWGLTLLTSHITHKPTCQFVTECSPNTLSDLTELSVLCDRKQLTKHATAKWLSKIRAGSAEIGCALPLAERLGLRGFQGLLYYEQLLLMSHADPPDGDYCVERPCLILSPDQQRKLYTGSWSLTIFWTKVVGTMIREPTCGIPRCVKQWKVIWDQCYLSARCAADSVRNRADYIASLQCLVDMVGENLKSDALTRMCIPCYAGKLEILQRAEENLDANLADHFLGCDPDSTSTGSEGEPGDEG